MLECIIQRFLKNTAFMAKHSYELGQVIPEDY